MKLRWTAMVAVAAIALPGTAIAGSDESAGGPHKNASKLCKSLKAQMGAEAFKTAYGTNDNRRNAHGKCVRKHRHAVKRLIAQAVEQCKAEQQATQSVRPAEGDKGGNPDKRALRECVKQKVAAMLAERREAFDNAAEQCRAEREADPAAFREKYGSNESKRNAFGKCVSKTAREELKPAPPSERRA